jgi:prepilin-type N-terminal cleavage/methylation domain-containing protein
MYIKAQRSTRRAWTLVEMMMSVAVFSIVGLALATIFLFSLRSFTAMANYALLDQYNRQAMDNLTYEIRQASRVMNYVSNATSRSLTLLNGNTQAVTFTFDSSNRRVLRIASDGTSRVLLTNCDLLDFNLYMRPPTNGTFDVYPVNMGTDWQKTVKVIQLSWRTAMTIAPTARVTSEDIQTARIIIRKQQDEGL